MADKFKALFVEEFEKNKFKRCITEKSIDELPDGDVLIKVLYSALNYKDALSARGHRGITRKYPFTPGIDAAGTVEESSSENYLPGQEVLVTGYDLGMNTSGGFGQYIRVPEEWVVKLPANISVRESMIYGTAGFTAGICLYELERLEITPDRGDVLVTGATGGVGSLAVGMLAKAGYDVIAATGKMDKKDFLFDLGAKDVIPRDNVDDQSGKPLLSGKWAGVIETVGGNTLSTAIRSTKMHCAVCCLGNVRDDKINTSVYPFILRGVYLIGIDSAEKPMELRLVIWNKITNEWRIDNIERLVKEVTLDELDNEIDTIMKGNQTGKVIVNLWK